MSLYQLTEHRPEIDQPILIVALEGWVDAGDAATTAADRIAEHGQLLAAFDPDALFDFRARRPALDIVDGRFKAITWPDLTVRYVRVEQRDLLVMTGHEPDYRWRDFTESARELATRLGVIRSITLGAIGWAAPHTQPVQLLATASQRELLRPEDRVTEGPIRVPAAAVTALDMTLAEVGIPTVGFWAQVPHYVSSTYYDAVRALVQRLGRHLEVPFNVADLEGRAAEQREALDRAVAERPEVAQYVQQLEELSTAGGITPDQVPSGEEIAAEIERFLRGRND